MLVLSTDLRVSLGFVEIAGAHSWSRIRSVWRGKRDENDVN